MKILFLATWFPYPCDNGSKLRVYYLLRSLAQQHEVTLLSFAFATAQPDASDKLHDWCQNIQIVPTDPFVANKAGSLRTFLSMRPVASRPVPAMRQLVSKALHSQPYDAVIASTGMMINYALVAPSRAAKVLEEHNSMTRWAWDRFQESTNAQQKMRRWLSWRKVLSYESRTYPRFDLITMVSEADRRTTMEAVRKERSRVEVVPNGVDCEHNQPGLSESQPNHLVFNGSLTYSANYDAVQNFLVEIYPQIKAALPDTVLTITGSTTGVDLSKLALDNSVRLTGYVDDIRIPVAEASVAIAPIRQGGGTRLKILEAMALGTPVVATSKAAEGLHVLDGKHLLIADAPQQFANSVVRLLTNRALNHRLQQAARQRVAEQYDWQQIGQQFVCLIENSVTRLC